MSDKNDLRKRVVRNRHIKESVQRHNQLSARKAQKAAKAEYQKAKTNLKKAEEALNKAKEELKTADLSDKE
ncbi:hypothetical protein, partial [Streptococcus gallolyticus]